MRKQSKLINWKLVRSHGSEENLIILFHGSESGPRTARYLVRSIHKTIDSYKMYVPSMSLRWSNCFDLKRLIAEINDYIDDNINLNNFKRVILVGHSAGGVIAQAVYLNARREKKENYSLGSIDQEKIKMILLAPINLGWELSHHLPLTQKISWMMGLVLFYLIFILNSLNAILTFDWNKDDIEERKPWLLHLRRGSPVLVWMRLAWLEQARKKTIPRVFVLIGSIDEIISWRDMVDSVVGGEFLYLNVPESDHTALIDFRKTHAGNNRRHIFENVLKNTVNDEFNPESSVPKLDFIEPWDIDPSEPDPEVKQVVFVIHGIRDVGHWTQKIALETKKLWREAGYKSSDEVAVVTSSYGFFSMLEFILAIERFRKIQWLVDRYVEAKRLYPNAKFSFIGHSNGTYLVAQALKLHKDIEFDRLAFAGSVVSANYKWYPLLDSGNVKFVLNVPATFDWVVSLFPRVADALPLQWLLGPNLGAAGVIPFKDKRPKVRNQKYKNGQHGVAIKEDNWEDLARFAILNKIPNDDEALNNAPCRIFGEKIGDLTCVAAITILIFLFFYHIPLLIWGNPLFCVCFSVSLLFGTGLLITILQGYSDLSSIDSRERFRKRSTLIALVAVVMVIILLSLTIYASLFYNFEFWDYWNSDIPDGWRGAAIVSYIVVLYAVLTKV